MIHWIRKNSSLSPPFSPARSAYARRYATVAYIVYAMVILGQGGILCSKLGKSGGIFTPLFLVPCFYALLVLALAFARNLRGVIGLFASLHFVGGLMVFVLVGVTLCEWEPSEPVRPMDLMWMIIFGNCNVIIPLAVFIAYLVESNHRCLQRRDERAWNRWRQNRQEHLPLEERLRLRRRK